LADGGLRFDLRLMTMKQDEQPPLGPGMLDRDSHQLLDQLGENDLARESL
jgi:hypothetical protein